MKTVKKVASFVALVLSVLFLLVFLASTVGVWVVRSEAIQVGDQVATVANNALERGQSVTARLSSQLDVTQGRISTGVSLIQAAGAKAEQAPVVLNLVQQLLDTDLTPAIENIKDAAATTRDALAMADQMISLMQRLPGSKAGDSDLIAAADAAIQKLQGVDQRVQDANQAVRDAKSNTVTNVTDALTAPLEKISTGLQDVQSSVQGVDDRLAQAQVRVQEAHNNYNLAVTGIAFGMTIVFLWLALSQFALFIWAYRSFTGRDLLARKPTEEPSLAPAA